jgi:hypothetical protein
MPTPSRFLLRCIISHSNFIFNIRTMSTADFASVNDHHSFGRRSRGHGTRRPEGQLNSKTMLMHSTFPSTGCTKTTCLSCLNVTIAITAVVKFYVLGDILLLPADLKAKVSEWNHTLLSSGIRRIAMQAVACIQKSQLPIYYHDFYT